jgi:phosphate transport system substrate-binding protein
MKRMSAFLVTGGLSALVLFLLVSAGCGDKGKDGGTGGNTETGGLAPGKIIQVDGSSTVHPVTEVVAKEFQDKFKGQRVTVGVSGTGGGFKKFCRGETDISNASRPISKKEIDEAKKNNIDYIELPVCFDALTVVVSKENTWVDYLTIGELKKMWDPDNKVTKWSDIRAGWPDEKFVLFGPGTDSGTFDYFTEAVCGKSGRSRSDYTASEDDNVLVTGVSRSKYALGYFGFAYYEPNKDKIKGVPIKGPKAKDKAVMPSAESVLKGTYTPLSRPLFIYVNKKSVQERPEVKAFVEFYLKNGSALARQVKYVPLPKKAYTMALERFNALKTGSAFGGAPEVGLPVEEILRREPK